MVPIVLLLTGRAHAEPGPSDRAIAERLYDQGRKQLVEGRVAAACDSFAESMRLDPGTGILLNLAACHENMGKLASAWVEFREALTAIRREGRADRMRYAQERLSAIEPRLAYLTIEVPEVVEGDAPAVALDGRALGPAVWGMAIPVDAGWHEVVAQTANRGPWRATVKIRDGERRQLAVPADVGAGGALDVAGGAAPADATLRAAPDASTRSRSDGRRVAGVTLGALGLSAVVVGGYFGWRASSLWADRNRACPMDRCSADGIRLGERADASATVATWTIGAGVAAVGAAALILFLPVGRSGNAPAAGPVVQTLGIDGHGAVALGGTF